jgi:hypothetical protein
MGSKSKLVAAAAAAGAVCAFAASTPQWTKHNAAVPNAYTNTTPGLSQISVKGVFGTFVTWKGRYDNDVHYKFSVGGKWSASAEIPGARTNTSPAAAFYTDLKGQASEVVVWKQLKGAKIYYAQGVISGTKIGWTKVATLPGGFYSSTTASPSVLFPINAIHPRVIIAFRGPFDHVRYIIGTESGKNGRGFYFGKKPASSWIGKGSKTHPTTTGGTPELTEIASGSTSTVYVFWKGDKDTAAIDYASTPDNAGSGLEGGKKIPWTLLGSVPTGKTKKGATIYAATTGSPAVSSASPNNHGPLLLAYKGPSGFNIRFQTLTGTTWSEPYAFVNGNNNTTAIGPALVNGTLANVSRTTGRIYLHHFVG